jgi:molybdenum-dependent DNA-binding transcriptional regulator ModE
MYKPRKQTQNNLLSLLAQNKELYQGDIAKKLDISYRNAIRDLQLLARNRLIQSRLVPSEKQGPGRKVWTLTLKGLCQYCANILQSQEVLSETVIEKWGTLLPFLNKFGLFKKHELGQPFREEITRALAIYLDLISEDEKYKYLHFFTPYFRGTIEKLIGFDEQVVLRFSSTADIDSSLKWNRVLNEDEELRRKTKSFLEEQRTYLKFQLSEIEGKLEQVLPLLEKPNPDWDGIIEIEHRLRKAPIWPAV